MELSAKVFGLTPYSLLAPQALMGVLSTLMIYVIIRSSFSGWAALIGSIVFFTTPIVVLMSRYNNPDPLMLLLMLLAVRLVQLAIASNRTKYLLWTAVALGLAFMTKQLQGLLVLPSIAAAYFCWSGRSWPGRVKRILAAAAALVVTGGLWMVVVDVVPPQFRPYVGGSPANSILELTLGYNGIDRVISKDDGTLLNLVPQQFRQLDSDAGFARLLNANYGQEIGWLLLCGVICTIMVLCCWRKLPASPEARSTAIIATTWFLLTFLVLSFMGDQIHTYYTAALAPPLSLAIGIASDLYFKERHASTVIRLVMSGAVFAGALSSWLLLSSVMGWPNWLPTAVICSGALGASMLAVEAPNRWLLSVALASSAVSVLAGPVITSWHNMTVPHNGSNPVSGMLTKNASSINHFLNEMQHGEHSWAYNLGFGREPSKGVVRLLQQSTGCKWAAATYASQTAARLQIESDRAVMPVGGFAGTDPSPMLPDFIDKVRDQEICYFLADDGFIAAQTGPSAVTEITNWVEANFEAKEVEGQTVYDLRRPH